MSFFGSAKRKPGWMCINLWPDRVDVSHVLANGKARPEVLLCDSYRKEADDVTTLKRLRRDLSLGRYRCTTLLKQGDYQILPVEAPNVPAAEMKIALRWRLKDLIDFPVEAATVDALTLPQPENVSARNPQVLAVVANNELIAATAKTFNDANIPLEVMDIPELAQRNLAHLLEEQGRGLALLTFDENGGLLTFTCNNDLYQYRRLEQSNTSFVNLDEQQRQQLYDRIVLELQRSLDNFDRQYHRLAISGVVVMSVPGADDLQEYLTSNLGVPVTLLDLSQIMDFPDTPELREPARQGQCLQMIGASLREEGAPA
jgi:MSHA biogenesis protein MshI